MPAVVLERAAGAAEEIVAIAAVAMMAEMENCTVVDVGKFFLEAWEGMNDEFQKWSLMARTGWKV